MSQRHDHDNPELRSMMGRTFGGDGLDLERDTLVDQIYRAFAQHSEVNLQSVRVTSLGGEIMLTGEAETVEAKAAAEDAARSVSGVTSVTNNIQVGSGRAA